MSASSCLVYRASHWGSTPTIALVSVFAVVKLALLYVGIRVIPQDEHYHHFVDQRTLLGGVPNTLDVLSNLAFVAAALYGLSRRSSLYGRFARVVRVSVLAVAVGSMYYHVYPTTQTLVFDRLPMTVVFMCTLAFVYHIRDGAASLPPIGQLYASATELSICGVLSVVWWRVFDDLTAYAIVQYASLCYVVYVVGRLWRRRDPAADVFAYAIALYALAKVAELADHGIFAATGGAVSGHTVKHLLAAFASALVCMGVEGR
jgi:hypothetical protein